MSIDEYLWPNADLTYESPDHIDGFLFSARAARCLAEAGLTNVRQIDRMPDLDLLRIPNLGRLTLADIRKVIRGNLRLDNVRGCAVSTEMKLER